jgi:hypothetical protein
MGCGGNCGVLPGDYASLLCHSIKVLVCIRKRFLKMGKHGPPEFCCGFLGRRVEASTAGLGTISEFRFERVAMHNRELALFCKQLMANALPVLIPLIGGLNSC